MLSLLQYDMNDGEGRGGKGEGKNKRGKKEERVSE